MDFWYYMYVGHNACNCNNVYIILWNGISSFITNIYIRGLIYTSILRHIQIKPPQATPLNGLSVDIAYFQSRLSS